MSDGKNNDDVLKKLRDVRRKLQESLNEDNSSPSQEDLSKKILVDGQADIEKADKAKEIEAKSDELKKPKLYKAGEESTKQVAPKKLKAKSPTQTGLSAKKMAGIQQRIQKKVSSRQSMTKKRRAFLVAALVFSSLPLLLISSLAFTTCEFNLDNIGFSYNESAREDNGISQLSVTLPIHNPGLFPATLSGLKIQLNDHLGNKVGDVYTHTSHTIMPKQTTTLALRLDLQQASAGPWLTNFIQTFELKLAVSGIEYSGITIPGGIELPVISLKSMVYDLVAGMDLGDMITGLVATDVSKNDINAQIYDEYGYNPETGDIDVWKLLKTEGKISGPYGLTSAQSTDDMMIDISEKEGSFEVNVSAAMEIGALDGFSLGVVKISDLSAGIYADVSETAGQRDSNGDLISGADNYDYPLIELSTWNKDPEKGDLNLIFADGANSDLNLFLNISKDEVSSGQQHPSALFDWDNPTEVATYLSTAPQQSPLHYFLYNLLNQGSLNCLVALNHLSIEVFGIQLNDISIPRDLLGVIDVDGALNIQELVGGMMVGGLFSPVAMLAEIGGTGGLSLLNMMQCSSLSSVSNSNLPQSSSQVDIDALGDMLGDIGFGDIIEYPRENLTVGLSVGINEFLIDLSLGLSDAVIGLGGTINGISRNFAIVEVTGSSGNTVYLGGLGANETINVELGLLTDAESQPYVVKFVRDLLEEFKIDAIISVNIGAFLLFRENYTIPNFQLSIPLSMSLGDIVSDMLPGLLEGALTPEALFGTEESASASNKDLISLSGNPLTLAYELAGSMLLNNPVSEFLTSSSGMKWVQSGAKSLTSSQIPVSSQDFEIAVNRLLDRWSIDVGLIGMDLGGLLPVNLGIGASELNLQGKNNYGQWENMIGLKINNEFLLADAQDISLSLQIYDGDALCNFLHTFLYEGNISLKIDGYLTLTLAGMDIPNLHLSLAIEDVDTGFDLSSTIDAAVTSLLGSVDIMGENEPQTASETVWWDGDVSKIPFLNPSLDIDQFFEMGDFMIYGLDETGWPSPTDGEITITLGLGLTNHIMEIGITQLELEIWAEKGNPDSKMVRIDTPGVILPPGSPKELVLTAHLYKQGGYLQAFLSNVLANLTLYGAVMANVSLRLFGCDITGIELTPENAIELQNVLPSIADLLQACIPFSYKETMTNGLQSSQDIMDIIGKFALLYITMPAEYYNTDCGPLNFTSAMLDIRAGVALMPNFNMTLKDVSLQICDAKIYDAIFDPNLNNIQEASLYSLMAGVDFEPNNVYFNNTYSSPSDPNNYTIDPNKPYYNAETDQLYYQPNIDPNAVPYMLSTYGQFEISLKVYNISHGTYETKYPRNLWRKMGGPYFPVEVLGKDQGAYPDHKYIYHPYFSPAYNILGGVLNGLNIDALALDGLLSAFKINGSLTINIFSMDVTLNFSSEAIANLMTSLLGGLSLGMREVTRKTVAPSVLGVETQPIQQFVDSNGAYNEFSHAPKLPTSSGLDMGNMAIDLNAFILDYPYVGVWERNDHLFAPQYGWGGTNVSPDTEGYVAGLAGQVTGASNVETFVKDDYYNWFKIVTENYRRSVGSLTNPYFEIYDEHGNYMPDSSDWALKWLDTGRVRSAVLVEIQSLTTKLPIGVLGAALSLWIEDTIPCSMVPFAYAFINESVVLNTCPKDLTDPTQYTAWKEFTYEEGGITYPKVDNNGKPISPGDHLALNIRMFEGAASRSFFQQILDTALTGFQIRLVIGGYANASLFGYEFYNIQFSPMDLMGDPTEYAQRCVDYQAQFGGGGVIWDVPDVMGYVDPNPPVVEDPFPPEEFIPDYAGLENTRFLSIGDDLLAGLDILGLVLSLLGNIDFGALLTGHLKMHTDEVSIASVFPIPAWLEYLDLGFQISTRDVESRSQIMPWEWIDLGIIRCPQYVELLDYPGQHDNDPTYFDVNILQDMTLDGEWVLQPINIDIDLGELLGGVGDLLRTGKLWLNLDPAIVAIGLPIEWDYTYLFNIELGELLGDEPILSI